MVRVIVADDNTLIRMNIRQLIERQAEMKVIAEARDGGEVIRALDQYRPDVLLLDIEMPGMSGIDVLRAIQEKGYRVDTVVVSGYSDSELIRGVFELGARGFVVKEDLIEILPQAIQAMSDRRKLFLSEQARLSIGMPGYY